MSKFEVYKDKRGKWRWRLIARNGETLAGSESYRSKGTAVKAAERAKVIAAEAIIALPKKRRKRKVCGSCK